MQLPDASGEGKIQNGSELVPFDATWRGDTVDLEFRWTWVGKIVATRGADGTLHGSWIRDTPLWGKVERTFAAAKIDRPTPAARFAGDAPPAVDVTGTWRFHFKELDLGIGELVQNTDGTVTGWIRPGTMGDSRFLAGEVQGDKLLLSSFNGNLANLVTGVVGKDGKTMTKGLLSVENVFEDPFTAEKVNGLEYINRVKLKAGKTRLTHVPGLDKYKGKPVVVMSIATWCHACNDSTPFMVGLHAKYKDRGLQFLSVAYDLSDDQRAIDAELAKYKAKYGIPWETIAFATTPDAWAGAMPPEIEGWDGYPVTAFINPDGTVHAIYGGWFSGAAPDDQAKLKAQFDRWAAELLPPT